LPIQTSQTSQTSPSPATHWWNSPTTDDDQLEAASLDIFLRDFVVQATDRDVSRGFLDGMPSLLRRLRSPDSDLPTAAKLVALASVANKLKRKGLLDSTRRRYCLLIQRFNRSLSLERGRISIESLYTAVLLGLYEVS
jgi:hypothetical protein